jgi:hypothetical protein
LHLSVLGSCIVWCSSASPYLQASPVCPAALCTLVEPYIHLPVCTRWPGRSVGERVQWCVASSGGDDLHDSLHRQRRCSRSCRRFFFASSDRVRARRAVDARCVTLYRRVWPGHEPRA